MKFCPPFLTSFVEVDASESGGVVTSDADIPLVLGRSRDAQVSPSVVHGICVDVVDLADGPFTGHVQPRQAAALVLSAINVDPHTAIAWMEPLLITGDASGSGSAGFVDEPSEDAGVWIVTQHIAQTRGSEYLLLSHFCCLDQQIGQVLRAADTARSAVTVGRV